MKNQEFTNFANSFQAIAKLGLENIERLLFHLGNPQNHLKFIHIAGTNGKGSTAAYLQCILTKSGKKTGKYISPNMISVCERISIDGEDIAEEQLNRLLEKVRIASEKCKEESGVSVTQFEIWTAAAFLYFKEQLCDIVVLETGLGGRKDATNIIPPPLVSVITHIAMDHTEYLGDTIEKIAYEKAGIIKTPEKGKGFTVISNQSPEVLDVVKKVTLERNNELIITDAPQPVSGDENGEIFNYRHINCIKTKMLGRHQLDNAAVAIDVALHLGIGEEFIKRGIEKARNIGRFEIISKSPLIVFDGAHNPDGMTTLKDSLNRYFPDKTKSFIMATMADKDISSSLEILNDVKNLQHIFTVTVRDNPRAMAAENLAEIIKNAGFFATASSSITDALLKITADMTVICGSLYLYKDYYDEKNRC